MPRRRARRRATEHSPDPYAQPEAASPRQLRVGEELRHVLAQLLRPGNLHDPALQDVSITVTEVRMSPDLRNATAFVMPLAGARADDVMVGLRRSAGFLKGQAGRVLGLRRVPNLVFALDRAFDHAARISAILSSPEVEPDLGNAPTASDDPNG